MSLMLIVNDIAHAALIKAQEQGRQSEWERQRELMQMDRERWERERERERIAAHARERFGGIGWLLLLLEQHKTLIINLVSLYTFYKVVMKLVDCNNIGYGQFSFSLLILVSLRIFLFRTG
ncbi:hypothetical protein M407DRAFT_23048 [Tulasnella calospora MUT 4182]|uniref:Uncharacterized protein n=1 Tax=Tulasnella calospora MUT 4182 TaxID=1051891 RepID=A0A0C3M1Z4_9AGAM|nr:hypothetical protein M407DRAFT_23048 [Tulasnella calospora MUT 4182]